MNDTNLLAVMIGIVLGFLFILFSIKMGWHERFFEWLDKPWKRK